jgi:hypothetical protein
VSEIRLAGAMPPAGFLRRRGRRLWEVTHGRRVTAGTLRVTADALILDARADFRGRLEIGWDSIRRAVVDDGTRWGYVAGVCRFPVYDAHADGSGSGALIGPLWSQAACLMPPDCAMVALDPVPAEAPNLALLLEPRITTPSIRDRNGHGAAGSIALMLLRAEDPQLARGALASHTQVEDVDLDDLEYLRAGSNGSRPAGAPNDSRARSRS